MAAPTRTGFLNGAPRRISMTTMKKKKKNGKKEENTRNKTRSFLRARTRTEKKHQQQQHASYWVSFSDVFQNDSLRFHADRWPEDMVYGRGRVLFFSLGRFFSALATAPLQVEQQQPVAPMSSNRGVGNYLQRAVKPEVKWREGGKQNTASTTTTAATTATTAMNREKEKTKRGHN